MLDDFIDDNEWLFRGVVEANWDYSQNRPSSATFKDSNGVSVDRDAGRSNSECIIVLSQRKPFKAISRVLTSSVRQLNAIALYKPISENLYHSEIHDSADRIQIKGSKAVNIRDKSEVVFIG